MTSYAKPLRCLDLARHLVLTILFLSISQQCSAQDGTLFGIDFGNDNLVKIDRETGALETVGPTNPDLLSLAYDATTTTLFGITADTLYMIDMKSGDSTLVGSTGFEPLFGVLGTTFDNRGNLYAIKVTSNADLFNRVDPVTAAAMVTGPTGFRGTRLAFDSTTDTLFGFGFDNGPRQLLTIDRETGVGTSLGFLDSTGIAPMSVVAATYDPVEDQLLTIVQSGDGPFFQILVGFDKTTGQQTGRVSLPFGQAYGGLTFVPDAVPEPSAIVAIGLAAGTLILRRRR